MIVDHGDHIYPRAILAHDNTSRLVLVPYYLRLIVGTRRDMVDGW